MSIVVPTHLPNLDPFLSQLHADNRQWIMEKIKQAGGRISFETFMQYALYAPEVGYYTSNTSKLDGHTHKLMDKLYGDFTTAPELSPWFGYTIAEQLWQIMQYTGHYTILEFGAGTGALAESILSHLKKLGNQTVQYLILELSPDLKARQQERLKVWSSNTQWIDSLPNDFEGCILANEVLDAMPIKKLRWEQGKKIQEFYVTLDEQKEFTWTLQEAQTHQAEALQIACQNAWKDFSNYAPPPIYDTELGIQAQAWIRSLAQSIKSGVALLIDYGYTEQQYYHPQRSSGTLMCHFQHLAHDNPLIYSGVQDITAHVNFSAIANTAINSGFEVLGFTSQAHFLMNCGLLNLLGDLDTEEVATYARIIGPIQRLLSEAQMGESFKVMALGKNTDCELIGFSHADRCYSL